jgi:hypothetical protein
MTFVAGYRAEMPFMHADRLDQSGQMVMMASLMMNEPEPSQPGTPWVPIHHKIKQVVTEYDASSHMVNEAMVDVIVFLLSVAK